MQIKTPDIGVDKANVAEILVKVGDRVEVDDSIVVLESDKATVEVPSTSAGVVKSILINQGDDVTEGVALIEIEAEGAAQAAPEPTPAPAAEKPAAPAPAQQTQASAQPSAATSTATVEVTVPDIGVEKALVGEILVKVGDQIDVEQSIVVVESDKA
ncbi:biotin/lipoyl-containing protein, partial [Acinetobacter baumannii]